MEVKVQGNENAWIWIFWNKNGVSKHNAFGRKNEANKTKSKKRNRNTKHTFMVHIFEIRKRWKCAQISLILWNSWFCEYSISIWGRRKNQQHQKCYSLSLFGFYSCCFFVRWVKCHEYNHMQHRNSCHIISEHWTTHTHTNMTLIWLWIWNVV